ncbi:MAG TPA: CPBP family glutamic-type intramembrane protease [Phycisphaerales bacterium]|nr:CPBP family glutamic-type intramembrane protease [Phycisphaerales bacterium]
MPGEAFLTSWSTWAALAFSLGVLWLLWSTRTLRPGVLARGLRDLAPIEPAFWFIASIVGYAGLMLGSLPAMLLLGGTDPASTRGMAITGAASFTVALAVSGFLAVMIRRAAPAAGLTARPRTFALGLVCLPLCVPILYFCSGVFQLAYELQTSTRVTDPIAHPALRTITSDGGDPWAWVMIAVAVVLAPIHEELVYRGFLQSGILRLSRRPWAAIVITAALFALAHVSTGVPWYAVGTLFVFGVCLGFAFERSRSIAVPIALHMAFNAMNVVVAVLIT